jgi:phytoene dehydrogenase-like protein
MGPVELEQRDRNLVGGDVGGGSYRLRQVVFRPVPGVSPYRTPLSGLYLGSAAAFPGGAVHGVPGDAAARAALADASSGGGVARLLRGWPR